MRFHNNMMQLLLLMTSVVVFIAPVAADPGGRLIATGGVSTVEGAAGGGLVPWAITGTYATAAELDVAVATTTVNLRDYNLAHASIMVNWHDRVEFSLAQNRFDLGTIKSLVNYDELRLDVAALKWRIAGDAVFEADQWWPQLALGVEYKRLKQNDFDQLVSALGAEHERGSDVYLSLSKVYLGGLLGRNVVANLTFRSTQANQFGLLGFGGDRNHDRQWQTEASLAILLTDRVAVGAEYREKPNNLSAFEEHLARDLFVAWFVNKHLSLTLARVDLGTIAIREDQTGNYASLQWVF